MHFLENNSRSWNGGKRINITFHILYSGPKKFIIHVTSVFVKNKKIFFFLNFIYLFIYFWVC